MKKNIYSFILTCWLTAVFTLLLLPVVYIPPEIKKITFYDKYAHAVMFGVATYLFLLIGIRWRKFKFRHVAIVAFAIMSSFNIFGEYLQNFIPYRIPSLLDFTFGLIGTLAAIPIAYMLHYSPRKKILLHVCCAPCASAAIEALSNYKLELYFYNPCIYPEKEYLKRLQEIKKMARKLNLKLHIGKYEPAAWKKAISSYEKEPEGGTRCDFCFRQRLQATAALAVIKNFSTFATTLTVSPHKNSEKINRLGRRIGQWFGRKFLDKDFKKNNGYARSIELSKKYGLYRQNYCGCKYSQASAKKKRAKK